MARSDTCRLPGCEERPEEDSRYCSVYHEVKYEHLAADAEDAQRAAEEESREERGDPARY